MSAAPQATPNASPTSAHTPPRTASTPLALHSSETTAARASLADLGEGTADAPASTSLSGAATPSLAAAGEGGFSTKPCLRCGFTMTRGTIRPGQWKRRNFCSYLCANRYKAEHPETVRHALAPEETKPCLNCGATLYREGAHANHWAGRKYCDDFCRKEYVANNPDRSVYVLDASPRIKREWPAEERFDRPGMVVAEQPVSFRRFNPHMGRWI